MALQKKGTMVEQQGKRAFHPIATEAKWGGGVLLDKEAGTGSELDL